MKIFNKVGFQFWNLVFLTKFIAIPGDAILGWSSPTSALVSSQLKMGHQIAPQHDDQISAY